MIAQRILIIGGGFLGNALARALDRNGHRVTILSPVVEPSRQSRGIAAVCGRQEDETLVAELLRENITVVHTAWGTTPGSSAGRPTAEGTSGLAPMLGFLEILQQFPSARLVFLSSGGTVYGNSEQIPVPEDAPLLPLSYHGAGKAAAELFVRTLSPANRTPPIIVRPCNVYGPGQPLRTGFGVLRHLLQCVLDDEPFTLLGNGAQVRDYLYVDDFIDAVARLAERDDIAGTFNVGSGRGTSLRELIALVEGVTQREVRINPIPSRAGDVDRIILDISKILRATGWSPIVPLKEGITKTWEWLRTDVSQFRLSNLQS